MVLPLLDSVWSPADVTVMQVTVPHRVSAIRFRASRRASLTLGCTVTCSRPGDGAPRLQRTAAADLEPK
jgi:hypothetical protein